MDLPAGRFARRRLYVFGMEPCLDRYTGNDYPFQFIEFRGISIYYYRDISDLSQNRDPGNGNLMDDKKECNIELCTLKKVMEDLMEFDPGLKKSAVMEGSNSNRRITDLVDRVMEGNCVERPEYAPNDLVNLLRIGHIFVDE